MSIEIWKKKAVSGIIKSRSGKIQKRGEIMTIEIDTHAHTLVSGHAYNTMREMVQMAAEKGIKSV